MAMTPDAGTRQDPTMTINALADRYAAAKAVFDAAEAELKSIKAEIEALGVEEVEGARCFVKVALGQRNMLDAKAVEAALGAPWVKANTKQGAVYAILRVVAKPVKKLVGEALEALEA